MVDSVSGNNRPVQVAADLESLQASPLQKVSLITRGHDGASTVSFHFPDGIFESLGANTNKPIIPDPTTSVVSVDPEVINDARMSSSRERMILGVENIKHQLITERPSLVTPVFLEKFDEFRSKISKMSSASPESLQKVHLSMLKLRGGLEDYSGMDIDTFERLMIDLQTKLQDNSIKYAEVEITSLSEERQAASSRKIEDMREHIAKHNSNKGFFGFKIAMSAILFPLGIWEGFMAIDRAVTKEDNGLSIFSSAQARSEQFSLANQKKIRKGFSDFFKYPSGRRGSTRHIKERDEQQAQDNMRGRFAEAERNTRETNARLNPPAALRNPAQGIVQTARLRSAQEIQGLEIQGLESVFLNSDISEEVFEAGGRLKAAATGLELAREALPKTDMMKLLQQIQHTEENKEALEAAIAALERGDPEAAAELLAATPNQHFTGGGDDAGPAAESSQQNPLAEPGSSTAEELAHSGDQWEMADLEPFLAEMEEVPQQLAEIREDTLRQSLLIQRGSRV